MEEEKRQYSIEANKRNNSIKGLRNNKIKSHAHQKKRKTFCSHSISLFHTRSAKSPKCLEIESAKKKIPTPLTEIQF